MASVTLHNAHKENNRAKCERSFAHLLYIIFQIIVMIWVRLGVWVRNNVRVRVWVRFKAGVELG